MKKKKKNKKNKKRVNTNSKALRSGSKAIKVILLEQNPHCDICGSSNSLELHHVFLIRHGFPSELERCRLLCPNCHRAFHHRWDKYLDLTFQENPHADFNKIYETIKKL